MVHSICDSCPKFGAAAPRQTGVITRRKKWGRLTPPSKSRVKYFLKTHWIFSFWAFERRLARLVAPISSGVRQGGRIRPPAGRVRLNTPAGRGLTLNRLGAFSAPPPRFFRSNSWTLADIDMKLGMPLRTSVRGLLQKKIRFGLHNFEI